MVIFTVEHCSGVDVLSDSWQLNVLHLTLYTNTTNSVEISAAHNKFTVPKCTDGGMQFGTQPPCLIWWQLIVLVTSWQVKGEKHTWVDTIDRINVVGSGNPDSEVAPCWILLFFFFLCQSFAFNRCVFLPSETYNLKLGTLQHDMYHVRTWNLSC